MNENEKIVLDNLFNLFYSKYSSVSIDAVESHFMRVVIPMIE